MVVWGGGGGVGLECRTTYVELVKCRISETLLYCYRKALWLDVDQRSKADARFVLSEENSKFIDRKIWCTSSNRLVNWTPRQCELPPLDKIQHTSRLLKNPLFKGCF